MALSRHWQRGEVGVESELADHLVQEATPLCVVQLGNVEQDDGRHT
jgi:hypothetical protein